LLYREVKISKQGNDAMKFAGKCAVTSGAARGIGRATALKLAAEGAKVALLDINAEGLDAVAESIRSAGGTALSRVVDLKAQTEVKSAVADILVAFGQIDILVNCAGAGWHKNVRFKDLPDGSWEWILDLNVKGTMFLTQAVLGNMVERQYGKIVNLGSIAGNVGLPGLAVYSASKGAITSFTKALAMELGSSNINVNCISPGLIASEESKGKTEGNYLERWGMPSEVADLILFLVSENASYITGVDYLIDGGRVIGPRNR